MTQIPTTRSRLFGVLGALSFPIVISILVAVTVYTVPQLRDLIHQTQDEYMLFYALSLVYFCTVLWWTSRFILDAVTVEKTDNSTGMQRVRKVFDGTLLNNIFNNQLNEPQLESVNNPDYFGGRFGVQVPRYLPLFFTIVATVMGALQGKWLMALLTLGVGIGMTVIFVFRRSLYGNNAKSKYFGWLLHRWTWFVIVAVLFWVPAIWAIASTQHFAQTFGGLAIVVWGLGSVILGGTLAAYTLIQLVINPFLMNLLSVLLMGAVNIVNKLGADFNKEKLQGFFMLAKPYPVVGTLFIVAVLISTTGLTDNHAYRLCDDGQNPVKHHVNCATEKPYTSLGAAFARFKDRKDLGYFNVDDKQLVPVIFVANQGGGLRASYWSNAVLARIEHAYPGLHKNIFAMSGASGGTVGNISFVSALDAMRQKEGDSDHAANAKTFSEISEDFHANDFLSPVVTSFLFNDLLYRFLPIPWWSTDRAAHLEIAFEGAFKHVYQTEINPLTTGYQAFYDQFKQENDAWMPIVIGTTAIQELGLLALTTPFEFESSAFPRMLDLQSLQHRHKGKSPEQGHADVSLITTAINSARFPYVTPKGSLDPEITWSKKLHTGDAGYIDNYGSMTIKHMLDMLSNEFAPKQNGKQFVPVLLIFKNSPDYFDQVNQSGNNQLANSPFESNASFPPNCHKSWALNELVAPIQTLSASRGGHADKNLVELIKYHQRLVSAHELHTVLDWDGIKAKQNTNGKVHTDSEYFGPLHILNAGQLLFEYESFSDCSGDPNDPPLGWWLSGPSRTMMNDQAEKLVGVYQPMFDAIHIYRN